MDQCQRLRAFGGKGAVRDGFRTEVPIAKSQADVAHRLLKTASNKAAGSGTPGAYAVRVCEEGTRLTTTLGVVFRNR